MIELARHIEILLVENDCVIIPDFGGFIVHYQPAYYAEAEHCYLPPMRTIGFNPQLKMNDGLLVQSYMQTYHTDFPDATRMIAKKVKSMQDMLTQEGMVELKGIGHLKYNMHENLIFEPSEAGIPAPALYGLEAFNMLPLTKMKAVQVNDKTEQRQKLYRSGQRWLGKAVAAAAAVILFFFLSVPVENTYVDKGNYASLGTDELFSAIREQSLAATFVSPTANNNEQARKKNLKPVAIRVEKVAKSTPETTTAPQKVVDQPVAVSQPAAPAVKETKEKAKVAIAEKPVVKAAAPAPTTVAKKTATKSFHIIAASLTSMEDAKKVMKKFEGYHFGDMQVIESKGRFRLSVMNFENKEAAYKKMNEMKKNEAFKNAWLLTENRK